MTETIWILGGSGDIGRAIGERFGREGWSVWLSARTRSRLRDATAELNAAGIDAQSIRADAARPEEVERAVSALAADGADRPVLVYNVSPQELEGTPRLDGYLRHTVGGAASALTALRDEDLLPAHVIVPTSSKAREPAAVSPPYHASKQGLFAYLESFGAVHGVAHSILWLGRRGTETDWRWLRPSEMAEKAWEAYRTGESEVLVGDLY